jgi:hypothetical protein
MAFFNFLKGRTQDSSKVLADAYCLVDESLNERAVRGGEQLLKAMQAGIEKAAKNGETALVTEYHSCLKGVDDFRDRVVQISFADMGELQRAVFDMNLEAAVKQYIHKKLEPLLELIKKTLVEDSAYALAVIKGTLPEKL